LLGISRVNSFADTIYVLIQRKGCTWLSRPLVPNILRDLRR
jgi:hypothetical protein